MIWLQSEQCISDTTGFPVSMLKVAAHPTPQCLFVGFAIAWIAASKLPGWTFDCGKHNYSKHLTLSPLQVMFGSRELGSFAQGSFYSCVGALRHPNSLQEADRRPVCMPAPPPPVSILNKRPSTHPCDIFLRFNLSRLLFGFTIQSHSSTHHF